MFSTLVYQRQKLLVPFHLEFSLISKTDITITPNKDILKQDAKAAEKKEAVIKDSLEERLRH